MISFHQIAISDNISLLHNATASQDFIDFLLMDKPVTLLTNLEDFSYKQQYL